jgi:parallel beta-helix repeat protein
MTPTSDVKHRRRELTIAAGVALAAALVVAQPSPATSRAPQLSCGATITVSTKLDRDLVNCANNGIVIGADNVTLDLNGHVIDGDGAEFSGCGADEPCDVGVVAFGHSGVTIKGGTIREFGIGVLVVDTSDSRITHLAASNSLYSGVILAAASRSSIEAVTASRNGLTTDQAGIDVFDSRQLSIFGNRVDSSGDIGFFISGLDDSRIEKNVLSRNPEAAILLDHGNGNVFSQNRISESVDIGIVVSGDANTVSGNLLTGTGGCSSDDCGYGISLEGGTGNVVEGNTALRFHRAGIRVAAFEQFGGPTTRGNTVRLNLVQGSALDGLLVESTATDTVLDRNTAVGAGDDGIEVDNAATTLTRNLAARNGDHGIEAVAGVTDGGGNHAFANGNPVQCTFVAC